MTRQAVLLIVGTFFALALVTPTSVVAGGWPDQNQSGFPPIQMQGPAPYGQRPIQMQDQRWNKDRGGILNFGPTGKNIARIALTAAGTVVAGLFGSQFGMVGTVIGGAAGFIVSRWIGNKLFGESDNYAPGYQQYTYGQQYWGNGPRWSQTDCPKPPIGFEGDIKHLKSEVVRTYNALKGAIAGGTQGEKDAAKAAYDHAREAYARGQNTYR
ncbi:MAG: hypothetical protein HY815_07925 [Candidatus Riflebacteria bacterium]|nr:hypothetical protein [Candidatus Riflebacteria bacterium]